MSSLSRSIRRHAQRERMNTVDRKLCPDCRSVLKAKGPDKYACKKCNKLFLRRRG